MENYYSIPPSPPPQKKGARFPPGLLHTFFSYSLQCHTKPKHKETAMVLNAQIDLLSPPVLMHGGLLCIAFGPCVT